MAACDDGSIRIFSLDGPDGEAIYHRQLSVGQQRLLSIAATTKDILFVGGANSQITKWNVKTCSCESKILVETSNKSETLIWALASLGEWGVASGDSLGLVTIWDPVLCVLLFRFAQHQADVLSLSVSTTEDFLVSAGIDAKVSTFSRDGTGRWVFSNADFAHSHDIRTVALGNGSCAGVCVSGGIDGRLMISRVKQPSDVVLSKEATFHHASNRQPLKCSGFSPYHQTASIAEESRMVLCQCGEHLDLWHLQTPKEGIAAGPEVAPVNIGTIRAGPQCLPEAQLVMRVSLTTGGDTDGQHICASAIRSDGQFFAASDLAGTRLFRVRLDELEVQRENHLPSAISQASARRLLFCGTRLLAVASWRKHEVLLLDTAKMVIAARFKEHQAPILQLACSLDWLASSDASGSVHVFHLDSLTHHSRLPVGDGQRSFPTALGFIAEGRQLAVATSSHDLLVYDVEEGTLTTGAQAPRIPTCILMPHERICGVSGPSDKPNRVLLWGHSFLVTLDLEKDEVARRQKLDDEVKEKVERGSISSVGEYVSQGAWRAYGMQHILTLQCLDVSRWGAPLLREHYLCEASASGGAVAPPAKRQRQSVDVAVLALEVTPQAVVKALPTPFERKQFYQKRK